MDGNFVCLFYLLRHTKHEHSSKGAIFFHSCDYNTFSFHIGEGTLSWATPCFGPSRFFFKLEENKYFSPYAYCFIFKSDLLNPKLKKMHILYCFSWKVTFSTSKVNFWIFGFIETKRLNIDSFTNEN